MRYVSALHDPDKVDVHSFLRQRLFRVKTGATRHAIKDGHHERSIVSSRDCTREYTMILVLLRASEILLKQGQPEDLYLFMIRRRSYLQSFMISEGRTCKHTDEPVYFHRDAGCQAAISLSCWASLAVFPFFLSLPCPPNALEHLLSEVPRKNDAR